MARLDLPDKYRDEDSVDQPLTSEAQRADKRPLTELDPPYALHLRSLGHHELASLIERLQEQLRISYPMTPVDCLLSELREMFIPVLSKTSVLTIHDFERRVAEFKNEVAA